MVDFKSLTKNVKELLLITGFNVLLSAIGLLLFPGKYIEPFALPWILYILAYIGYIPIGGFLLFAWLGYSVILGMYWTTTLSMSLVGFGGYWAYGILIIWTIIAGKRSIETVARIVESEEDK
jgi:hypothetical protein